MSTTAINFKTGIVDLLQNLSCNLRLNYQKIIIKKWNLNKSVFPCRKPKICAWWNSVIVNELD